MNQQQLIDGFRQLPIEEQRAVLARLQDEILMQGRSMGSVSGKITPAVSIDRSQEYKWVAANKEKYAGQWIALKGDQLLAYSAKFKVVSARLKELGITDALMLHIEALDALPYAGI